METPARAWRVGLFVVLVALSMSGCSTAPIQEGDPVEPVFPADRILEDDIRYTIEVYDPWEGFNRTMYRFNYHFDRFVFLPVVSGYQAVLPDVAQTGLHNFWNNIGEIKTFYNSILQAQGTKALETAARFFWNSTAGLLGFIDVASRMDITRHQEDFGQTLGRWGLGPGPYLVLPIAGPSSLRDGVGLGADWFIMSQIRKQFWEPDTFSWENLAWVGLQAIDKRANIPFRYFETGSAFEYEMVRMLNTAKRRIEVEN